MRRFLRRWGALGGTGLVCWLLGVGMTDMAYHLKQAVLDTSQDGRLAAVEKSQADHLAEARPLVAELHLLSRKFDGLLIWLRIVAGREGWPPPPEPTAFRPEPKPYVPSPWWNEARAGDCPEGCP